MSNFYNFAVKIETSWAKTVLKTISKTRNANDVSMYVLLIHF